MTLEHGEPAFADDLEAVTRAWLEELRLRRPVDERYGPDLGLAVLAQQLVDDDRRRDGVRLQPGELTIERLEATEAGPAGGFVDLEATLVYPADRAGRGSAVAPGRQLDRLQVTLGAAYWERTQAGRWQLHDYVRDERRQSATWCVHPRGEDVVPTAGLGVVPQAITVEAARIGRLFLEVRSERDEPVLLRVGRPERPRGIFRRQPAVGPPVVGIPLPPHSSTHLVGRTGRPRLTEVEIFAFDEGSLAPLAELRVQVELPKKHPGDEGVWCSTDADAGT